MYAAHNKTTHTPRQTHIYIYILPTSDNEIQLVLLELPVDKYIELIGKCDNLV